MSTTVTAILIFVASVLGVLAVSAIFYAVGRSEDRDREREARRRGRRR